VTTKFFPYLLLSYSKVLSKKNRKRKRTDSRCTVSDGNSSKVDEISPATFSQCDSIGAENTRILNDWDCTVRILYSSLEESETGEERARRIGAESCKESIRNEGSKFCKELVKSATVKDTSTCEVGGGRVVHHDGVEEVDVEVEAGSSMSVGVSDLSCTSALLHCAKLLFVPRVLSFIAILEAEAVRGVNNTSIVHSDVSVLESGSDRALDVCSTDHDITPSIMCSDTIAISPATSSTLCPSNSMSNTDFDAPDHSFRLTCVEMHSTDLSVSFTVALKSQNKLLQSPFTYCFEISIDTPLPRGSVNPNPPITASMRRMKTGLEAETIYSEDSPVLGEVTELKGSRECGAVQWKGGYLHGTVSKWKVLELFQAEILRTNRR
jgi:hypothetical protein